MLFAQKSQLGMRTVAKKNLKSVNFKMSHLWTYIIIKKEIEIIIEIFSNLGSGLVSEFSCLDFTKKTKNRSTH